MSWQERKNHKSYKFTKDYRTKSNVRTNDLLGLLLAQCRDLSVLCHQKPAVAAVTMRSTHCLLVLDVLASQLIT